MGAGKMLFANYNELSDSTFKLTLFVCFVHGKNKIKMFPSYLKMESIRNWVSLIFSGKNLVMVHTARGFWNSLPFPNVFPTNVKFPRHTVLTISHIRPDDGLNAPPLTAPLHLYILMLSASHMQCTSGFLVAFGGTGCRGSAGKLAPFVPHVLMSSARVKNFRGWGGGGRGKAHGNQGTF